MSAHVYTYWRNDEPLYVGVTLDVLRRMDQHTRKGKAWTHGATHVTVREFATEASAYAAEVETIQHLEPFHNKAHNPRWRRLADSTRMWTPEELAQADHDAAMSLSGFLSRSA